VGDVAAKIAPAQHGVLGVALDRGRPRDAYTRLAFIAAALQLAEDLGDRGFDPTIVRPQLRLHRLSGENVWSISFAGQYRAVFHLGEQRRPGHAHIVWEFIGSTTSTSASTEPLTT
jgi:hypothetical protein